MRKMKFLLDENVHRGLFSFLIKLGYEVKLSPKAIKNGEVFRLIVIFILFMRVLGSGR